jgi:hypothetical protein
MTESSGWNLYTVSDNMTNGVMDKRKDLQLSMGRQGFGIPHSTESSERRERHTHTSSLNVTDLKLQMFYIKGKLFIF